MLAAVITLALTCLIGEACPCSPSSNVAIAGHPATGADTVAAQKTQVSSVPSEPTTSPSTMSAQTPDSEVYPYVIIHGTSGSWVSDAADLALLRQRFGNDFAWFRQNGHEYLVVDSATLYKLQQAMEPQADVNGMQADVNRAQDHVNILQSKVNAHQSDVNDLQNQVNRRQDLVNKLQDAVTRGDNSSSIEKLEAEIKELRGKNIEPNQALVNRQQSEVNREQENVNAEQAKVNNMQQKVNEQQQRVSAEFHQRMQEILGSAVKGGVAKQLK